MPRIFEKNRMNRSLQKIKYSTISNALTSSAFREFFLFLVAFDSRLEKRGSPDVSPRSVYYSRRHSDVAAIPTRLRCTQCMR